MSRLKRWLNMNKKRVNEDGYLKSEYLQELIIDGTPDSMIQKHAQILRNSYEELKRLDETDPEPWPIYTAYDFFTAEEQRQFNRDGSLKSEYIKSALIMGISEGWLEEMERRKKIEVDNYNQASAAHAEQGINYGAWQMQEMMSASRTYAQRRKQMDVDLRNFEDVDSLPFDKDTSY